MRKPSCGRRFSGILFLWGKRVEFFGDPCGKEPNHGSELRVLQKDFNKWLLLFSICYCVRSSFHMLNRRELRELVTIEPQHIKVVKIGVERRPLRSRREDGIVYANKRLKKQ